MFSIIAYHYDEEKTLVAYVPFLFNHDTQSVEFEIKEFEQDQAVVLGESYVTALRMLADMIEEKWMNAP